MTLAGRRVVLGVSGGIASYKACTIARRLTEAGAAVDVVMTSAAAEFVGPVTFEGLTGRPVQVSLWERGKALTHIHLARDPDLIVVAPATANLLARAAQGIADDLLTALLLAADPPILAAPAMNDYMFAHPTTTEHVAALGARGWEMIGPAVGPLAEGDTDRPGRMVEPEVVIRHVERALQGSTSRLAGKRVVVTAAATREPLDAVRVLTNPASGRMGFALAEQAWLRGADVLLIAGPTALPLPYGPVAEHVVSTREMRDAVAAQLGDADVLLMAAAPADYRPSETWAGKRPRSDGEVSVRLQGTDDVLIDTIGNRRDGLLAVGFALETGDGALERARAKLERKHLDLVVLNRADEEGAGFEVATNIVTLVWDTENEELPAGSKAEIAARILDAIERRL